MSTHKEKGNAAFRLERWSEAIQHYTAGIELDPTSPLTANLYSNRSACYTRKAEFDLGKSILYSICRALSSYLTSRQDEGQIERVNHISTTY